MGIQSKRRVTVTLALKKRATGRRKGRSISQLCQAWKEAESRLKTLRSNMVVILDHNPYDKYRVERQKQSDERKAEEEAARAKKKYDAAVKEAENTKGECKRCLTGPSYHKSHSPNCPFSQSYQQARRTSSGSTVVNTQRAGAAPTAVHPGAGQPQQRSQSKQASLPQMFARKRTTVTATVASRVNDLNMLVTESAGNMGKADETSSKTVSPKFSFSKSVRSLEELVDETMSNINTLVPTVEDTSAGDTKAVAPKPVEALVHALVSLMPQFRKQTNEPIDPERYQLYTQMFQGSYTLEVPPFNDPSSVNHIVLAGHAITFLQWELQSPGLRLQCPACSSGVLCHDRRDFGKGKVITPIFRHGKKVNWMVVSSYMCLDCKKVVSALDRQLMTSLPRHLQRKAPIEANWYRGDQKGRSQICRATAMLLDKLMVTESSAEFAGDMLKASLTDVYTLDCADWMSWVNVPHSRLGVSIQEQGDLSLRSFPAFEEWLGQARIPTGAQLRDLYREAKLCEHNRIGVSDHHRHELEIQAIGGEYLSQDHTFAALKNYPSGTFPSSSAILTMCNEIGQLCTASIMPGTAFSCDNNHTIEQVIRRDNVNVKSYTLDTFPNGFNALQVILGPDVKGQLGLFHWLNRTVRTLNKNHVDYHKAVKELGLCLYYLEPNDVSRLELSLRNGTLNGDKHSEEYIANLWDGKNAKNNYAKYVRKIFYKSLDAVVKKLEAWWVRYKVNESEGKEKGQGRVDPKSKRTLFTGDTRDAFECAKKTVEGVLEENSEDSYIPVPPTEQSNHGLTSYISKRPESKIEANHDKMRNYANLGMNVVLADIITLAGIAESNQTKGALYSYSIKTAVARKQTCFHLDYKGKPTHENEMWCHVLQREAERLGLDLPFFFSEARPLQEDTGERFMYQAYLENKERMANYPNSSIYNDRCACPSCGMNSIKLPHESQTEMCWEKEEGGAPVRRLESIIESIHEDEVVVEAVAMASSTAVDSSSTKNSDTAVPQLSAVLAHSMVNNHATVPSPTGSWLHSGQSFLTPVMNQHPNQILATGYAPLSCFPWQSSSMFLSTPQQFVAIPGPQAWIPPVFPYLSLEQHLMQQGSVITEPASHKRKPQQIKCCMEYDAYLRGKRIGRPTHAQTCFNRNLSRKKKHS